jgi:hypothetical protein
VRYVGGRVWIVVRNWHNIRCFASLASDLEGILIIVSLM